MKDPRAIGFDNGYFYDRKGAFLKERARHAYVELMRHHGYPVPLGFPERLRVSDYGIGEFTRVGLGAVMFANDEEHRYMLMDLFLLPDQMVPERWYEPTARHPAKMAGWLVRFGSARVVGEGEPNLPEYVTVPQCHAGGAVTVRHEVMAGLAQFVPLNRPGAHHWQLGGPEGAIVTEVANVHDDRGVHHYDPAIDAHYRRETAEIFAIGTKRESPPRAPP